MTWYFDPSGETLQTVQFVDRQGQTKTVAEDMAFNGAWSGAVPDTAVDTAMDWISSEAASGNSERAVQALADHLAGDWEEGSPTDNGQN